MRPEERDLAYLWDMREAAREVVEFTADVSIERYAADKKLRRAVERAIEIIGEACRTRVRGVSRRASGDPLEVDHRTAQYPRIRLRGDPRRADVRRGYQASAGTATVVGGLTARGRNQRVTLSGGLGTYSAEDSQPLSGVRHLVISG